MSEQELPGGIAVAVSGLEKSFDDRVILSGVSLVAEKGSLTAILGASGSGKTTLLRLIAGLDRPDKGAISLGGRIVDSAREHTPPERRNIGYVPQEGALFPHLTVAGNVGFGLRRGRFRRITGESSRRVAELIELVGLAGFERRLPQELSGRRASASRARPRARRRPRDRAARRAVLVDRRGVSLEHAARRRRGAPEDRGHGAPRHTRPGRGAVDRRPCRRTPAWHRHPVRRAGGALPAAGERGGGALRRPREPALRAARRGAGALDPRFDLGGAGVADRSLGSGQRARPAGAGRGQRRRRRALRATSAREAWS